jgi:hypothetical protein
MYSSPRWPSTRNPLPHRPVTPLVCVRAGCERLLRHMEPALEETMKRRQVTVHRGRHVGWWVEGRWANGHLFMMTWWPVKSWAEAVARLVGSNHQPAS